jgi:hypothetical protein
MEGSPRAYAEYFRINLWVRPTSIVGSFFEKASQPGFHTARMRTYFRHWPKLCENSKTPSAARMIFLRSISNLNGLPVRALIAIMNE